MTVQERGLTIGEFGRRSGLSVKALRLYDLSGLLPPAQVDPASGYRRYAVGQLDRARRISLLRRLDITAARRGSIGWFPSSSPWPAPTRSSSSPSR